FSRSSPGCAGEKRSHTRRRQYRRGDSVPDRHPLPTTSGSQDPTTIGSVLPVGKCIFETGYQTAFQYTAPDSPSAVAGALFPLDPSLREADRGDLAFESATGDGYHNRLPPR